MTKEENRLRSQVFRQEKVINRITQELTESERRYKKLYSFCRKHNPQISVIIHLEDELKTRERIIDRYQDWFTKRNKIMHLFKLPVDKSRKRPKYGI